MFPSLDLTEEQSELISEYAAGVILKYEENHEQGLMKVKDLDFNALNITPTPEPTPVPEPEETVSTEEGQPIVTEGEDDAIVSVESTEESVIPMNEAFGLDEAELTYSYSELVDNYPNDGEDLVFAMHSSEGKHLLISHFNLSNPYENDLEVSSSSDMFRVRLSVNETERLRGEITFIPNDLMGFSGVLAPGETIDTILVFEVPNDLPIESIMLIVAGPEGEQKYKLQ